MTDRALDDLARRVMLDAARQEYASLIDELPEHDFSPAFEKKMQRLIRRADHPVRYRLVQTAACLLLAAFLTGCSALAFSPAARAAFAGWIRELRQDWFSYYYTGEVESGPKNTVYRPTWLPEGYQEVTAPKTGTFVFALYENENGELLSFAYQIGLEDVIFHVERDNTEVRQTTVSGIQADFYLNKSGNDNVLVWVDEAGGIVFWISAPLTGEELVRVAESVRESGPIGWIYRPTWFRGGGFGIEYCVEEDGEGHSRYGDYEGLLSEFFYSKSGTVPYADRTDGERVAIGDRTGTLYPLETGKALTWTDPDTGYALWLEAQWPVEDMVCFAEHVEIYMHSVSSVFSVDTVALGEEQGPLRKKVEQALTDEFVGEIKRYARHDAQDGRYMRSSYMALVNGHMLETGLSPDREAMIAQVKGLMENDISGNYDVICLVEPFCFAYIQIADHFTSANIFDKAGTMIAGYTSADDSWSTVPTFEEMQFQYVVNHIYREAYRAAEAELNAE